MPFLPGLLLCGGGQGSQLQSVKHRKQEGGSLRLSNSSGLDLSLPGLSLKYSSDSLPFAALVFSRGRVSLSTVSYLDSNTAVPGH